MSADNLVAVVELVKNVYGVKEVTWPQMEDLSYHEVKTKFGPVMKFDMAMKQAAELFKDIQPEYGIRIFDYDSFTSHLKVYPNES